MRYPKVKEFIELADRAKEITGNNSLEWSTKYEFIFSDEILNKIFTTGVDFEWLDPDTTYEEDVMAFVNAVGKKADKLRGLGDNWTGTTCLDCKHFLFDYDWDGIDISCQKNVWWISQNDDIDKFRAKMKTAESCKVFEGLKE